MLIDLDIKFRVFRIGSCFVIEEELKGLATLVPDGDDVFPDQKKILKITVDDRL